MRISDWSSDVCSSDLVPNDVADREKEDTRAKRPFPYPRQIHHRPLARTEHVRQKQNRDERRHDIIIIAEMPAAEGSGIELLERRRSEEHTSELQSLMRISYAVFCLKKKK